MRLAAVFCLAPLALAGCLPEDGSIAMAVAPVAQPQDKAAQVATIVDTDDEPEIPASPVRASAFAPIPPKRPDFEGVTPASRALGAVVADAEQVDDQLEKQAAAEPSFHDQVRHEAQVRIVALQPGGGAGQVIVEQQPRPEAQAAPVQGEAQTSQPATRSGNGPGYYAAYEDTDMSCFPQTLRIALNTIAAHYGKDVEVTSGKRDHGRAHSMHRYCLAADIRVDGVGPRELADYAKTVDGVNGVGTYRYNTVTHIDIRQDRMAWRY